MAQAVSLELLKKHVRVDFDDDDEYLEHLLMTAEEAVISRTHRTKEELIEANEGFFPMRLKQAILVLAASWHDQRESISSVKFHAVPDSLQALIKPFVRLV